MTAQRGSKASASDQHPRVAASSRAIVQLVAPGVGGVRDYVEALRCCWIEAGVHSHVITLSEDDSRKLPLLRRLKDLSKIEDQPLTLLLHYSGYGFHKRAIGIWLLRELERTRRELGEELRIVTMFHELYASGPPWKSEFWLSGIQEWLARRIARVSDHGVTNIEYYASWLRPRMRAGVSVEVWPVFSTIGEPTTVQSADERALRLIVFGSESTRWRCLERLPPHCDALARAGIRELIEVGSGSPYRWTGAAIEHQFKGRLDQAELGALLASCAFGLLDYGARHLGKSTVFAAYAAHGCVAVNTAAGSEADGLVKGQHFLGINDLALEPVSLDARQRIADAASGWYANHTLEKQAHAFSASCTGSGPARG